MIEFLKKERDLLSELVANEEQESTPKEESNRGKQRMLVARAMSIAVAQRLSAIVQKTPHASKIFDSRLNCFLTLPPTFDGSKYSTLASCAQLWYA